MLLMPPLDLVAEVHLHPIGLAHRRTRRHRHQLVPLVPGVVVDAVGELVPPTVVLPIPVGGLRQDPLLLPRARQLPILVVLGHRHRHAHWPRRVVHLHVAVPVRPLPMRRPGLVRIAPRRQRHLMARIRVSPQPNTVVGRNAANRHLSKISTIRVRPPIALHRYESTGVPFSQAQRALPPAALPSIVSETCPDRSPMAAFP